MEPTATANADLSSRKGVGLRREVLIPVPVYRRASSLIGLGVVLVLLASAVDAVVWTYQAQRRFWREDAAASLRRGPTSFQPERRDRRVERIQSARDSSPLTYPTSP